MKLYKYIKSEFVNAALEDGCFRLGTMRDYSDEEKHGNEVGEKGEGVVNHHVIAWEGKEIDLSSNTIEAQMVRHALAISPSDSAYNNRIIFGEGSQMVFRDCSEDGLIFCASKTFDYDVMQQFECDACIVIKDSEMFFQTISKHIEDYARFYRSSSITYMARDQLLNSMCFMHPAFVKPLAYSHQEEYRAIWNFKPGLPISPVVIKASDCTLLIERFI